MPSVDDFFAPERFHARCWLNLGVGLDPLAIPVARLVFGGVPTHTDVFVRDMETDLNVELAK
jgi:hypothetical protein